MPPEATNSAPEQNATILVRLEERMIAMQTNLERIEKSVIPNGKDRMEDAEDTNKRQWAALVTLFICLAALTGQTLIPGLT